MFHPRETWRFDTQRIGRRVLVYNHVESTNTLGAQIAQNDPEPDGLVLVADQQSAGRGQYGRVWLSAPGSSLLMSVVLHPPPELVRPVVLTAWAAVSVAEAVLALTGVQTRIKWPNDLLIRGKKVCGILIEQSARAGRLTTVAGIGLNLKQSAEDFERASLPDATALGIVCGQPLDLRTACEVVVNKLDAEYARLIAGERVAVEADWKWRIGLLGRRVAVEHLGGGTTTGRLREMGFDGLEVEDDSGLIRMIAPESVAHIRATSTTE
jgi:BirA family biotin operon repressor/biotin-[acetyl-CoA-carboxylase] ligase